MCVDVLCAYLRMPYQPEPGPLPDGADGDQKAERRRRVLEFAALREVRHTVIRTITTRLREDVPVSWQGCDFAFTGVRLDGGNFTTGTATFQNPLHRRNRELRPCTVHRRLGGFCWSSSRSRHMSVGLREAAAEAVAGAVALPRGSGPPLRPRTDHRSASGVAGRGLGPGGYPRARRPGPRLPVRGPAGKRTPPLGRGAACGVPMRATTCAIR